MCELFWFPFNQIWMCVLEALSTSLCLRSRDWRKGCLNQEQMKSLLGDPGSSWNQKRRWACLNESQTGKTGSGAKQKKFIQDPWPGRMVGSPLKDHPHFLLMPKLLIGIGRGILLAFVGFQPFHLSSLWCLRLYPFIFLTFGTLGVRPSPCTMLANGDTPPTRSVEGRESAGPPLGSLEMLQTSACLPTLNTAPSHPGELVGVCQRTSGSQHNVPSVQPMCNQLIWSGRPAQCSDWGCLT